MPSVRGLRKLKLKSVALVPKGSNPGAHIALFKEAPDDASVDVDETPNLQDEAETSPEETNMSQTETPTPETTPEVEAEVTTPEVTDATAEVETPAAETVTETPAEATAEAAPEPVAAGVEKAEAETITKAEAAELRTKIAKLEADKREAEYVAKAKDEFPSLGNARPIAKALMAIEDSLDAETGATIMQMFKAFAAQADAGSLFAQFGKADAEAESAQESLEKAAAEAVERGEFKTKEQATESLLRTNTDLAKAVFAERS